MSNLRQAAMARGNIPRGAASLIVVMVLFFLLSLVAAYTGRNLIFEQRTSVNHFRAVQAFEAAEAGVEWALAMLNGGRIVNSCLEAGATTAETSFRQRYLNIDPVTGMITPRMTAGGGMLTPSCVFDGTNWVCSCPDDAALVTAPILGGGIYPAFRIRFVSTNVVKPGVIGIESQGCTRLDPACLGFPATAVESEGRALVTTFIGLKPALATPPAAALTVTGTVTAGAVVNAYNTEADRGGLALHLGNPPVGNPAVVPVIDIAPFVLRGPPGTPSSALAVLTDGSLTELTGAPSRILPVILGTRPNTYRDQPAAVEVTCPVGDCWTELFDQVARNPGRIFWIQGDLTLGTAGDIGSLPNPANPSVAGPVMLVVTGRVRFTTPGVRIFGFVYSQNGDWQGNGQIQGAAFIEGNLGATAAPTINVVGSVMDAMRMQSGSFVRIPGSWKDFE
jgi:hypothetical protein